MIKSNGRNKKNTDNFSRQKFIFLIHFFSMKGNKKPRKCFQQKYHNWLKAILGKEIIQLYKKNISKRRKIGEKK